MAERSPALAVQRFVEPLQLALSCVTNAVLVHSGRYQPGEARFLHLTGSPAPLDSANRLAFALRLQYRLATDTETHHRWNVILAAYEYRLLDSNGRELFAYHWHPESRSPITFPHLHLSRGGEAILLNVEQAHFPTGMVSLPEVLRRFIRDFAVGPQRDDWDHVLLDAGNTTNT